MTARILRSLLSWALAATLAMPPASVAAAAVITTPLGTELDLYLSRLEALGFSGAVLVAKEGKIILHQGYGLAERQRRIPYAPETVFDIGSITKQFTAAAILKLEMAGKLSVTDRIAQYFDAVPADKQPIPLHQLLTHTAGLQGDFGDDYEEMPRERLIAKALASRLQSAPGARYDYSNAGYSLLAAIVEKVSGQPYEVLLREQLFEPAEMTRTGYRTPAWQPTELAHGYEVDRDWGTPLDHPWAPDGPWWNLRGNGGLLSTVGDLYRWHQVLLGDGVLSKQAKDKYFARHVAEDAAGSSYYGYGWVIGQTPRGTSSIAHDGGNGVFAADFQRYIDEGAAIIAGSGQSDFQAISVSAALRELIFDGNITMPLEAASVDRKALERYTGTYSLPAGGQLVVAVAKAGSNGALGLTLTPDARATFETAMGLVPAEVRTRLGNSEARLLSALEQTRQGIYAPLAKMFGESLDTVKRRIPLRIAQLESRLGPFQRFELLGTVVRGERVATWVRFVYQQGVQVLEHVWQGTEVAWVRSVEGLGGSFFLAAGGAELFSFDPRSLNMRRIGVERDAEGEVTALVLRGTGDELRAVRK